MRGLLSRMSRIADDHALARGQAIGLHHNRCVKVVDCLLHFGNAGANRKVAGGNVMALQKLLRKSLARLKHGGSPRRAKHTHPTLLERIHNAQGERQFRSNNRQAGLLRLSQPHHVLHIFQVHGHASGNLRNAAIARRANHLRYPLTPLDRPCKRMFAATGPKDQDFHEECTFQTGFDSRPKANGRQCGGCKSNDVRKWANPFLPYTCEWWTPAWRLTVNPA